VFIFKITPENVHLYRTNPNNDNTEKHI